MKNPLYEVIDELTKLQTRMDNLDLKLNLILEKLTCVSISNPSSTRQRRLLIAAIEAKSQSHRSAAHVLLCTLPDPTWAETAPGCRIYCGFEREVDASLNSLRKDVARWLCYLVEDRQPDDGWPEPIQLACRPYIDLATCLPKTRSVSTNTAPGAS